MNNTELKNSAIGSEHWVANNGIRLYVCEKCRGTLLGRPVVVLAHESATAGRESFDLQIPGKTSHSLMDCLTKEGFDVFAPDIRGFGRSPYPEGHIMHLQKRHQLFQHQISGFFKP